MSLLGPEPDTKKDAEFILALVGKSYDHQLRPFFRGTVVSSRPLGPGQLGYLVKVQRPEGTAPDGIEYLCTIPGYLPKRSDVVDCMWRDDRTGYVFAVLSAPGASGGRGIQTGTWANQALIANAELDITVTLPTPWPVAHQVFLASAWPDSTWSGFIVKASKTGSLATGNIHIANGATPQNAGSITWISASY